MVPRTCTRGQAEPLAQPPCAVGRRAALSAVAAASLLAARTGRARAEGVVIERDVPGFGAHAAAPGDLLLVEYRGALVDGGAVFDSTLGGAPVRTNADAFSVQPAPAVPRVIALSDEPQPGVCAGLRAALQGMRVGGERTVSFGPDLGFGQRSARAPYATVPAGASLRYDSRLLRLSTTGPDALFAGVERCGTGGAGAQSAGCAAIEPRA